MAIDAFLNGLTGLRFKLATAYNAARPILPRYVSLMDHHYVSIASTVVSVSIRSLI